MNERTKIRLSPLEMELVTNTEWIFAKQLIIEKVYRLFGSLNEDYKKIISQKIDLIIPELQSKNGKISKGENYKGLPYIILDYPAIFSKENICAVRTLFWWGNFFSISLHLSGTYYLKIQNQHAIFSFLQENQFSVCISENEWEHDFNETNFLEAEKLNDEQMNKIYLKPFFKIAKKIELRRWNGAELFLIENFEKLIDFIAISFPNDEKVL